MKITTVEFVFDQDAQEKELIQLQLSKKQNNVYCPLTLMTQTNMSNYFAAVDPHFFIWAEFGPADKQSNSWILINRNSFAEVPNAIAPLDIQIYWVNMYSIY